MDGIITGNPGIKASASASTVTLPVRKASDKELLGLDGCSAGRES
jgi:hypothetical protein